MEEGDKKIRKRRYKIKIMEVWGREWEDQKINLCLKRINKNIGCYEYIVG
jgi:hypothetical protein